MSHGLLKPVVVTAALVKATSPSPVLDAKATRELLWISVGFI